MKLYIKNMVCQRCKTAVENILANLLIPVESIMLGEVIVGVKDLKKNGLIALQQQLSAAGFELIDDKKSKVIEQIKTFVINDIHYNDVASNENYSTILSRHLHQDYSSLSKLFSGVEGITIEQYILQQKIEKVKELLHYNEQSLAEIAVDMGYSSTAYLSSQFKKITGMTPTQFRQNSAALRKPLDKTGHP